MAETTTLTEQKLEGAINKSVAGEIAITKTDGMGIRSMDQAMEFAKLMALSREAVPKHLRASPGACLAICIQAFEWNINPFALANKSYVVNDRLSFEASLFQSVVARRAPIVGRIKMEYAGTGPSRTCKVWAQLSDGTGIVEYTSPKFSDINPKNSPLWKNDPDQQLFYFSVRSFARRHFPDVMMGIYTVDEMQDIEPGRDDAIVVDTRSKTERLTERLSIPVATTQVDELPNTVTHEHSAAKYNDVATWTKTIAACATEGALTALGDEWLTSREGRSAADIDAIEAAFSARMAEIAKSV